jgi:hypothetical protein
MVENRSSQRWRTVLKGQVVFNNRAPVLACSVQDLSDVGARIRLTDACELPPEFELEIPSRGLRLLARRIWSRGANQWCQVLGEGQSRDGATRRMAAQIGRTGYESFTSTVAG